MAFLGRRQTHGPTLNLEQLDETPAFPLPFSRAFLTPLMKWKSPPGPQEALLPALLHRPGQAQLVPH
jgi:hypothetical protein